MFETDQPNRPTKEPTDWRCWAPCVAAMLAMPLIAAAQVQIQPPTIYITAQTAGGYKTSGTWGDFNSDYMALGTPDILEHAEASIVNLGVPVLFADAEMSGMGAARANSDILYQIQVKGPQDVKVPLIVHVNGVSATVSRSGGGISSVASAQSRMWITNQDGIANTGSFSATYDDHILDQFGQPLDSADNFVTDTSLLTRANVDLVSITMDAYTLVSSSYDFSGKANAQLDPYIYIDPSFPNAALYTLVISAGVGNTPAPEPGTLFLLVPAVAALALRGRRFAGKSFMSN